MIRYKKLTIPLLLVAIALIFVFAPSPKADALSENEMYADLLIGAMEKCYKSNQMYKSLDIESYKDFLKHGTATDALYIPTGIGTGNSLNDQSNGTRIGCYELFHGDDWGSSYGGTMTGLFELFGKPEPKAGTDDLPDALAGIGYTKQETKTVEEKCISVDVLATGSNFYYGGGWDQPRNLGSVCWAQDIWNEYQANQTPSTLTTSYRTVGSTSKELWEEDKDIKLSDWTISVQEVDNYPVLVVLFNDKSGDTTRCESGHVINIGTSSEHTCDVVNNPSYDADYNYTYQIFANQTSNNRASTIVSKASLPSYPNGYKTAIRYFTDESATAPHKFTTQEKFDLYSLYLQKVYEIKYVSGVSCKSSKAEVGNSPIQGETYYAYTTDGWCPIQVQDKDKTVSVFSGVSDTRLSASCDFECLLKKMFEMDESQIKSNLTPGADPSTTPENYDDSDKICKDNSGPLGWILCPIINAVADIGKSAYEYIEENFLQIQSDKLFSTDSGLLTAWGGFRDIANIAFIILFLVVIFSQLTGVGIDNYGIKKILPKLIVTAILINLSFIICELATDVSNILGSGLNKLFTDLAVKISVEIPVESVEPSASGSIAALALGGSGAVLFGIIVGGPTVWAAAAAIGLAVLGIIISIVISILFLFIILMVRNAGIVILIAIAPVAFVCYMLPNTEGLFKKWVNLFKGLLVVYPICGLLIGGGKLAGHLLASIGGEAMIIAGMIVEVIPFFFIPAVLRSSLKLMGNVGAKLSGTGRALGRKASTGAQRQIRNTNRFKNFSQYNQERKALRQAERTRRRLSGRTDLTERQTDKLRKAQDVVLARRKEGMENRRRAQGGYYTAMTNKQDLAFEAEADSVARMNDPTVLAAERQSLADEARIKRNKARTSLMMSQTRGEGIEQLMARWNSAFDGGNEDELTALTSVINQRYGTAGVNQIADSLNDKQDIAHNANYQTSMRVLQQAMNEDHSFAGNLKAKTPDAFQMIGDAGQRYDKASGRMEYADMSYFTNHNQTATKASDWASTSGAALQRGVNARDENGNYVMSDDMIRNLLTSQDPSIMSGLQSEDGKREILEAALYNRQHNPSGVGPNLDNRTASANYRQERAADQARQQATQDDATRANMQEAVQSGMRAALEEQGLNIDHGMPTQTPSDADADRAADAAVAGMSDKDLGELATNPNLPNNDRTVQAAQREFERRDQNGTLKL